MTRTKADRNLEGEEEESEVCLADVCTERATMATGCDLLWYVGCDEGSHGHQGESQDEAQGEVDEGGAAQQHGQVQHSDQLQHPPALLRPLAWHEPLTSTQVNSSLSCITAEQVPQGLCSRAWHDDSHPTAGRTMGSSKGHVGSELVKWYSGIIWRPEVAKEKTLCL